MKIFTYHRVFPLFLLAATLLLSPNSVYADKTGNPNYLSVSGTKLYDSHGNEVRLTGVNWFGFENGDVIDGLWARGYKSMLNHIKELGFNCLRLPWSNERYHDTTSHDNLLNTWTPLGKDENLELHGGTPFDVLDKIIDYAASIDLKIILDNHSRNDNGYMGEDLWYNENYSEEDWINDWVEIAQRYAGNDAVIGMDLNNEPHDRASWGTGTVEHDWAIAAEKCGNAILEVNPDVLIIIEGTENLNGKVDEDAQYDTSIPKSPPGLGNGYWWGGNLQGVKRRPINLSNPNKLMYSPHEYGPHVFEQDWFKDGSGFPNNMAEIWDHQFGYLTKEGISHLLVGELGIAEAGGKDEIWFDTFLKYMGDQLMAYSWTFWCWNPNSGDTGGLVQHDWTTEETWKINYLKPYLAPMIGNMNGPDVPSFPTNTLNPNQNEIKVFPNPAKDVINVSIKGEYKIEIYTILGEKIFEREANTSLVTIDFLNAGNYFMVLSDNTFTKTTSFVKK